MEETLYLGSYTRRLSKGIHKITLDTDTKELRDYTLVAEVESPTYLTFSQDREFLYTIAKTEAGSGVSSFRKNAAGNYDFIANCSAEDVPPCYIAVDEERQLIYTASYHKGYLTVYKINPDNSIELADRAQHEGSSTHKNQDAPHVHYTDLSPDRKFLLVCDLGTDRVYTYQVSPEGKLTEAARYTAKTGSGPRHLVFHPNGTTAYLFCELSSDVETLNYDPETGEFSRLQVISSIPEDFTEFNGGAAIRISRDGRFVYASNRGHDTIAVFAVDPETLTLSLVEYVPTEGHTPRDFNLDASEQFVVVGHQDSDNLTLFERDAADGKLTLLQKDISAPECVCVTY